MIEEGLYQFLKQNTALTAVLAPKNSIYMGHVPESAQFPCLMFEKVSGVYDTTLDGPSGYVVRRYQFNCYGKDNLTTPGSGYVAAQRLADTLRQQLNGLVGTLPDNTKLFNAILDNDLDLFDDDLQADVAIQDYFIHFQQNP